MERTTLDAYVAAISSATTTEIVPAVPGRRIRVFQFMLENKHASTDTDITFKSATTAISGAFIIKNSGGSITGNYTGCAWFKTAPGEALNLTTSAAGNIVGQIQYDII